VSKAQPRLALVDPTSLLLVSALWMALHIAFLAVNTAAAQWLQLGRGRGDGDGDREGRMQAQRAVERAIVLVGSQKTLPVCVAVMTQLGGAVGEVGLCIIPCILAHMLQIVLDSFLVSYWRNADAAAAGC
jgi:sodium/bile acid cotransporter 7